MSDLRFAIWNLGFRFSSINIAFCAAALILTTLSGCDAIFGSKTDSTTDEIFDEGQIDPTLVDEVGYVPLNPFYTLSTLGGFDAPSAVYVGYDELIYVTDRQGLHVLDLAGRPQAFVGEIGWPGLSSQPIRDITAIVQDRRFNLYVAARRDTTVSGANCTTYPGETERCDLAVIYRITGVTSGVPRLEDIIWHPFDDGSRSLSRYDLPDIYQAESGAQYSDGDASFTGVAVLADNTLYAVRSGPVNIVGVDGRPNTTFSPFNALLVFDDDGAYIRFARTLSPSNPSLLSAVWPSAIATYVGPPQRSSVDLIEDFVIAQSPPGEALRYAVLSILNVSTPDGDVFQVDTGRLGAASNPENGDGFLYGDFRFEQPVGLAIAADETGYLFVVDAAKDSLLVFNRVGVEGVAPPPGAGNLRPVKVSFGGEGSGLLQFRDPSGVAYFDRIVYVADTGNNRIARYRLNTDFE